MSAKQTFLAIIFSVMGSSAFSATLDAANNFLDVSFTVPSQPASHDAIQLSFSALSRFGTITGVASLYDGTTLLASHTTTDFLGGRFFDPSSVFASLPLGTGIDYSSISDGSIDGRFTFQITSASPGAFYSFELSNLAVRTFGDSGNAGSDGTVVGPPTISSVPVSPVPLPAPIMMLGSVLVACGFFRRRRFCTLGKA